MGEGLGRCTAGVQAFGHTLPNGTCATTQYILFSMFIVALKGRSHEGVLEQRVPAFAQSMGSW